jgi:hypothetical protein
MGFARRKRATIFKHNTYFKLNILRDKMYLRLICSPALLGRQKASHIFGGTPKDDQSSRCPSRPLSKEQTEPSTSYSYYDSLLLVDFVFLVGASLQLPHEDQHSVGRDCSGGGLLSRQVHLHGHGVLLRARAGRCMPST